ncbi:MAG: hypothetical protein BECKG1743D_GA0114223_104221 [Candidatus Kentron sp. G]|nr:MAG: hypothetical protein BECKG1743F_GA0114225_100071 [Candidatus Kentron sp. G]VFM95616.1 MAG: hypothetical protein BECKG1743E_GA0114224_100091 [Candidatus Kentron sp. G]VFN03016.1 MAG: hypothetical protein BECKG1743D_GA0114223_104221 [Candidatus Kentron sp. G]
MTIFCKKRESLRESMVKELYTKVISSTFAFTPKGTQQASFVVKKRLAPVHRLIGSRRGFANP